MKTHLFVTYARQDLERVRLVVNAIRAEYERRRLGFNLWIDVDELRAGERWDQSISHALEKAIGLIVFVTPYSMKSDWVRMEVEAVAANPGLFILPVLLEPVKELPESLKMIQYLDLTGDLTPVRLQRAVQEISDATEALVGRSASSPVSDVDAAKVADDLAREIRTRPVEPTEAVSRNAVFIVHGHDTVALSAVETFLRQRNIEPIVLTKVGGQAQSLLQKFLQFSSDIRFAIVLLGADDYGASRIQYEAENVGVRALQFRTRQNVILELGFFYGYLGWENVFVLFKKKPEDIFPNFERPSDLDGVVFDQLDTEGAWQQILMKRLSKAGFT
jgi:predicted nucleotide-binding protein